jgi:hypothetical protein
MGYGTTGLSTLHVMPHPSTPPSPQQQLRIACSCSTAPSLLKQGTDLLVLVLLLQTCQRKEARLWALRALAATAVVPQWSNEMQRSGTRYACGSPELFASGSMWRSSACWNMWAAPKPAMPVKGATELGWVTVWATAADRL